jgi:hypothetical protein
MYHKVKFQKTRLMPAQTAIGNQTKKRIANRLSIQRQTKMESRAYSGFAFDPYFSIMPGDDLVA